MIRWYGMSTAPQLCASRKKGEDVAGVAFTNNRFAHFSLLSFPGAGITLALGNSLLGSQCGRQVLVVTSCRLRA